MIMSPKSETKKTAESAPNLFALKPTRSIPIGPEPMHIVSTPINRVRICWGALEIIIDACIDENPAIPTPPITKTEIESQKLVE